MFLGCIFVIYYCAFGMVPCEGLNGKPSGFTHDVSKQNRDQLEDILYV